MSYTDTAKELLQKIRNSNDEDALKSIEAYLNEAFDDGRADGYDDGYSEGESTGFDEGYEKGKEEASE